MRQEMIQTPLMMMMPNQQPNFAPAFKKEESKGDDPVEA
jgi:hypothetical protein